jgi:CheY-like chemotaxis protein
MATLETQGRPARLLLVEDNYADVLLTREAFRTAKVANALDVAADGEEALSMLRLEGRHARRPRPDLILLDLNLPRMDGREMLDALRADHELQGIPVIVTAGSKADIDALKASDLQANGYIVKPIDFDRLQEVVAALDSLWFTVVVLPRTQTIGPAHA